MLLCKVATRLNNYILHEFESIFTKYIHSSIFSAFANVISLPLLSFSITKCYTTQRICFRDCYSLFSFFTKYFRQKNIMWPKSQSLNALFYTFSFWIEKKRKRKEEARASETPGAAKKNPVPVEFTRVQPFSHHHLLRSKIGANTMSNEHIATAFR